MLILVKRKVYLTLVKQLPYLPKHKKIMGWFFCLGLGWFGFFTFPTKPATGVHFLAVLLLGLLVGLPQLLELGRRRRARQLEGAQHVAGVPALLRREERPRVTLVARSARSPASTRKMLLLMDSI